MINYQDWIGEWIDAEPQSTLPVLVAGCHAVHWAWDARGGKLARCTSSSRFRTFHDRLHHAESLLQRVLDREPENVTALTWLVTSSRGLQVPPDVARRRCSRSPSNWPTSSRRRGGRSPC